MGQGLGAGVLAAIAAAIIPFAAEASPRTMDRSPFDSVSSQMSLLHRVLIYAK